MTASMPQTLGVDISKEKLDVHLHPEGSGASFHNDRKGFSMLIKWLAGRVIARIVYEPTGAYHRGFERRFLEAGFPLAKVIPVRPAASPRRSERWRRRTASTPNCSHASARCSNCAS